MATRVGPMTLKPLFWVVATGVLVRLAVVILDPLPEGLGRLEPSVIAEHLNAGRGFVYEQYGTEYRAWKEPLYVVLLAQIMRRTGDSPWLVMGAQWLFGLGTALGMWWVARRLLSDSTKATLAGMLTAANPFLVYYDTHWIHPLSLDALCFVLVIGTILMAAKDDAKARHLVWAGLTMGVALWQRAALLTAGLFAWLITVVTTPRARRLTVTTRAAIWLVVAMAVISPWLMRNVRLFHRPVFTTDFAHIVWLGNNPWSNGTYSDVEGRRVIVHADTAFLAKLEGASELEQSDLFWVEARRFIQDHPGQFALLVGRRLWAFVWFSPNAGIGYAAWQGTLYRAAYAGLLALGLVGFWGFWRRAGPEARRRAVLLGAAVAGLATVHSLTAMNMKHRLPLELALAVFAAEALVCRISPREA
ncbi:MAG: glycosyltransferase family 39 protein [Candidatus Omnitrophica bacterium]|nr:glycosyltransferase family 39 protein [Candidatus Omnitrophota bacterium]